MRRDTLCQFGARYSNARDHRILDALLEEILRRTTLDSGTTWWQTGTPSPPTPGDSGDDTALPGLRNLTRTGSPYIFGDCRGTRRGTGIWVDMRPIPAEVVARFPTPQP